MRKIVVPFMLVCVFALVGCAPTVETFSIQHHDDSIYVIDNHGALYVWGKNDNGQLGVGDKVQKNAPLRVDIPKVASLAVIDDSVYAITKEGQYKYRLYTWGKNANGRLGVADGNERLTPTLVYPVVGNIEALEAEVARAKATLEAAERELSKAKQSIDTESWKDNSAGGGYLR
ncbi:MAG: hypothetical protein IJD28_07135 [Deferribacterales bacterium]|nr:hypothetical protein [Deferribacterales bacterium]